jgi:hypothetical protein
VPNVDHQRFNDHENAENSGANSRGCGENQAELLFFLYKRPLYSEEFISLL